MDVCNLGSDLRGLAVSTGMGCAHGSWKLEAADGSIWLVPQPLLHHHVQRGSLAVHACLSPRLQAQESWE